MNMGFLEESLHLGVMTMKYPALAARRVASRFGYKPIRQIEVDCLLENPPSGGPRLVHIANYNSTNAGDLLLTSVLRDLTMSQCGPIRWTGLHAHDTVTDSAVAVMNRSQGVIIGGGGLFLRDTNPNALSGWQWSCSLSSLARIRVPIVLFAVGYNRFRGQPEFDPIFREHLAATAEKALFIGLRNSGSIRAIRGYLPVELHDKLRYQPCMTTLMSRFYPQPSRDAAASVEEPFVALNCAFDRAALRFGDRQSEILEAIAEAAWRISRHFGVKFYSHHQPDETILPYLDRRGVRYELVRLYETSPATMINAYSRPALSIGMRGHAQMIPFGCQRPILSLISHDKLRWFLEDIDAEDWGVEIDDPDLADRLSETALGLLGQPAAVHERLVHAQDVLWRTTVDNLRDIGQGFKINGLPLATPAPALI